MKMNGNGVAGIVLAAGYGWITSPEKSKLVEQLIPDLPFHEKGDGFAPEQWLPDLVSLAHQQGRVVNEVPLAEVWQAVGVNTRRELAIAQDFYRQ